MKNKDNNKPMKTEEEIAQNLRKKIDEAIYRTKNPSPIYFQNEKHKEMYLKSMKDQEMDKTPVNYEEELKRHRELQITAAKMEEEYFKNKKNQSFSLIL